MLTASYKLLGEERDYREELVILHNTKEIGRFTDGGEPEDNRFSRDWNWVAGMIEKAYALGRNDVHSERNQEAAEVPSEPAGSTELLVY